MKSFSTLLLICMAFGISAKGQPDTINLSRQKALNVLRAGYEGKIYKEQRDSLISISSGLRKLIEIKQLEIDNLNIQKEDYKKIVALYEKQIQTMNDQKKIAQGFIDGLNHQLKKERRKNRWIAIAGIVSVGATIYLLK